MLITQDMLTDLLYHNCCLCRTSTHSTAESQNIWVYRKF